MLMTMCSGRNSNCIKWRASTHVITVYIYFCNFIGVQTKHSFHNMNTQNITMYKLYGRYLLVLHLPTWGRVLLQSLLRLLRPFQQIVQARVLPTLHLFPRLCPRLHHHNHHLYDLQPVQHICLVNLHISQAAYPLWHLRVRLRWYLHIPWTTQLGCPVVLRLWNLHAVLH